MRLNFRRKDPEDQNETGLSVVIISASCCIPGMAVFDEQARRVVERAISETGVNAGVKVMPATTAYFGGAPKEVIAKLMNDFNQGGQLGVPAILINGKPVSYGVPQIEDMKAALLQVADVQTTKEEE